MKTIQFKLAFNWRRKETEAGSGVYSSLFSQYISVDEDKSDLI